MVLTCLDDIIKEQDDSFDADSKYIKLSLQKLFYSLTGNYDELIKVKKKLIGLSENVGDEIERILSLGDSYYNSDKKHAYQCYRKAFSLFEENFSDLRNNNELSFFGNIKYFYLLGKAYLRKDYLRKIVDSEKDFINLALLNGIDKDIKNSGFGDGGLHVKDSFTFSYFIGRLHDIYGNKELGKRKKLEAAKKALENNPVNDIAGNKNAVFTVEDNFLGSEIIYKNQSSEGLSREISMAEQIGSIISSRNDCSTIKPIGEIEHDKKKYYIMEQASGSTLDQRINSGDVSVDDFCRIADVLGLLHARVKGDFVERDVAVNIKERISRICSSGFVDALMYSIEPAISSLEDIIRVYNKDAHSRNFKLDELNRVVILDTEGERKAPIVFDDTNLLDQHLFLDYEQKREIMRRHWDSFNENSDVKIIDYDKYELAYLNSSILRALEIYEQAVRINNHFIKDSTMTNAITSLRIIEEKFPDYYEKYADNYKILSESLHHLAKTSFNR
ncbi:hypothetical protein J4476_03615 [Candidatus Woesearchaeota archaeon]|nr:MAG: hypothetical protein QT09_C0006G0072 [archaeon GW2011_AR18]MBS3161756.1 hypothetical protein [Candidatus Woesearchaeota archaeon]HIH26288.1 hypothetical protein [Nanoarchaeota archaeon]